MESKTVTPKLSLQITTYEFYGRKWHPTVTHTFYGDTEEELHKIRDAHRKTDTFFNGSFTGSFNGIILMNGKETINKVN